MALCLTFQGYYRRQWRKKNKWNISFDLKLVLCIDSLEMYYLENNLKVYSFSFSFISCLLQGSQFSLACFYSLFFLIIMATNFVEAISSLDFSENTIF